MDGELGLERTDAPARRKQLGSLTGRKPGLLAPVDALLSPPVVKRLVADSEVPGDVDDLAARGQKIEGGATQFGSSPPPWHAVLLSEQRCQFQYFDSTKARANQSPTSVRLCSGFG